MVVVAAVVVVVVVPAHVIRTRPTAVRGRQIIAHVVAAAVVVVVVVVGVVAPQQLVHVGAARARRRLAVLQRLVLAAVLLDLLPVLVAVAPQVLQEPRRPVLVAVRVVVRRRDGLRRTNKNTCQHLFLRRAAGECSRWKTDVKTDAS